jgi:lysophospholipase L1-like esterase
VGKYGTLGSAFDRIFRNTLNKALDDVDTDIKAQKKRVDDLIVGNPQPSEVVDARGGKPVLKDRLDDLSSSLAQKANQTDLDAVDNRVDNIIATAGDGTIPTELSDLRTGSDGTVYTTAKQRADSEYNNSIHKVVGKNKFNKNDVTTGYMYDANSGNLWASAGYSVSAKFPVKPNTTYNIRKATRVLQWNSSKAYISGVGISTTDYVLTTSANTYYLAIDTQNANLSIAQVEEGSAYTSYEEYKLVLDTSTLGANSISKDKLESSVANYLTTELVTVNEIILPSVVTAVVGRELNIYYDNIIKTDLSLDNYNILVTCPKGLYLDDRFTVTPAAGDVGSHALQFVVFDKKGNLLLRKDITLNIIADNVLPSEKKFLFIGDSLTDFNVYLTELKNLLGANLTLLGTRGTAPVKHEGRGGWSTVNYVSNATVGATVNAFWNTSTSAFDFSYYMTQQGYTSLDYVVIFLGTNDLSTGEDNVVANIKTMINSIQAYNSAIKVFVVQTPPPSNSQYIFGEGRIFHWDVKKKYQGFDKRFMTEFTNTIPVYINLDSVNDFPTKQVQISARNTGTRTVSSDRYHPNNYGYYKIADIIYNTIIKEIS